MTRKRNLPPGISVISLRLSTDAHDKLREAAEKNHRTVSQEARAAIHAHLQEQEAAA